MMKNGPSHLIRRPIILCFLLFLALPVISQNHQDTLENGLDLNVEDEGDLAPFRLLDKEIQGKKVFFSGEDHRFSKTNSLFKFKLLKYLHQNAGVRIFLVEYGHAPAWLINKYLETGDSTIINMFDQYSPPHADLYRNLREYNLTLDEKDQIKVMGVDLEKSPEVAVKVLNRLIPDDAPMPPKKISLELETIEALDNYHDKLRKTSDSTSDFIGGLPFNYGYSTRHSINLIVEDFRENKALFREHLGKGFKDFEKVITGLEKGSQYYEYQKSRAMQAGIYREELMFERFKEILHQNPDEKFYGQFGRCHTSLNKLEDGCNRFVFNTLVSKINNASDPLVKDKVCSIATFYPKSPTYLSNNTTDKKDLKYLKKLNKRKRGLYLYDVGQDSILQEMFGEKFQFIVINRTSSDEEESQLYLSDMSREPFFFHLEGTGGARLIDFSNLNELLTRRGKESFLPYRTYFGGGMTFYQNNGMGSNLRFLVFTPERRQINDSTGLELKGFSTSVTLGKDIIPSENLHIAPMLGMSYSELTMTYNEPLPTNGLKETFFYGNETQQSFRNPALSLDASLDMRLNIGFIGIGLRGGFHWDVSDYRWREEGAVLSNSAETDLSGFFAELNLSLQTGRD